MGNVEKIKIDPEFRDYMPAVETDDLEAVIVRDGCRDALILWQGKDILVDGHRRKKICDKHGIGFRTVEREFADRDAVFSFIDELAIIRRNLTPEELSLRRGRIYNREKKSATGFTDRPASGGQNVHRGKTAEKLAKQQNVDEKTIRRDGEFAAAVDEVKTVDPQIESKIARGKAPAKAKIIKAAKAPTPAAAKAILAGEPDKSESDTKPDPAKPWLPFSDAMEAHVADLERVSRQMFQTMEIEASTRQAKNKWAHFLHYDGSVGGIRSITKTILDNLPAELCDKSPGFIPIRQQKISKRVNDAKSKVSA